MMRFRRLLNLTCAMALLAAAAPGAGQAPKAPFAPDPGRRTVYSGATLIDGTGGVPRAGMAIVTRGETIEAVVPADRLTAAMVAGAERFDVRGRWIVPGLIDSHQHFATPPNRALAEALMRRDLYSGITSTRIMADDLRAIAELARAARAGEIAAPDLHFAALVAGRGFFGDPRTAAAAAGFAPGSAPWMQAIDAGTDIPLAIARARGTGAAGLKIYADLPPALVRALTREAKRQGLAVWAHGMVFPTRPVDVVAAGPDTVSHICYLAYQVSPTPPARYADRSRIDPAPFAGRDNPVMARLFADIKARGIVLDPTLRVYREAGRRAAKAGRPPHCTLDLAARLTDQARRAGVLLAAGTDGDTARSDPYPALFEEVELLVRRGGLTPLEAIRSATSIGALAMGRGAAEGTIRPGQLANFVVLERDPLAEIANLRSVATTVKRGRRFPRADYRPITQEEMPDNE